MRSFFKSSWAIAALCAALSGQPAFAQDSSNQDAVRIEIDQKAKAFVFIIDDEPVAMLDKSGLHVPGEVNYGLWITDTGPDFVREKIALRGKEVADD